MKSPAITSKQNNGITKPVENNSTYVHHYLKDGVQKIITVTSKLFTENLKDFLGATALVGTLINKIEKFADSEILKEIIKKAKDAKDFLKVPFFLLTCFFMLKKSIKLLDLFDLKSAAVKKLKKDENYIPLYYTHESKKSKENAIIRDKNTSEVLIKMPKNEFENVKKDIACKRIINFTFFIPAFIENTNSFAILLASNNICLITSLPVLFIIGGISLTAYAICAIVKESFKLTRAIKKLSISEDINAVLESLNVSSSVLSLTAKVVTLAVGIFLILEALFAISVPGALPILTVIGLLLLVSSYVIKGVKEYIKEYNTEKNIELITEKLNKKDEPTKEVSNDGFTVITEI